jgi:hypothetical protein
MMEIERLKKLQAIEDIEAKRVENNRKGAAVIIEQIQDREIQRQQERESVRKENAQMIRNIELMKQQDLRNAEIKQERNKRLMAEVEVSNKIA